MIEASSFREILRITGNGGDGDIGVMGDSLLDTIILMFMEKVCTYTYASYYINYSLFKLN